MKKKIKELEEICDEMVKVIHNFPKDKIEVILFDKWSLKDVIAHINGWNKQKIFELDSLLEGKDVEKISDFDAFNENSVNDRKNVSWDIVFQEFVDSCRDLVEAYDSIPAEQVDVGVWPGSTMTPRVWLQIDLDHMKLEHLPEIKRLSNTI